MTLYAMAFLCKDHTVASNIIVVDGSPIRDDELMQGLTALGVEYLHLGRELSFAETYNAGIKRTSSPVVVTLANDVLINAQQLRQLAAEVNRNVGCVLPYLTQSDYGAQTERRLPVPRRCFPSRMTFNVNAFSRDALEKIGFIPEEMTGCYNDVMVFIRLREMGYSIMLRNVGHVIHLAQQTLKSGSTSVCYEGDERLFAQTCPKYWRDGTVLFHKVAQRWTTRIIYQMVEYLPVGLVRKLGIWNWVWAIEPYLCAEQGTLKEALRRVFFRRQVARNPNSPPMVTTKG
jgi:GT2 family glycosyltransferase